MPNRKRSTGPRAPPKLFRCTGYGNCNMVFTRSEHLARHERKHTGEKPYKCIVPGCDRMFSRFDNMMQHTQTHEKNRKSTSRAPSTNNIRGTTSSSQRMAAAPMNQVEERHIEEYISDDPPSSSSMINSRTLPLPTRRTSISTYQLPNLLNSNYRASYPSASTFSDHSYYDTPRNRASWPLKRETPYYHPYHEQHDSYNSSRRRSSVSTVSSEASSLISPMSANFPIHKEPEIIRRRISIDDLRLPIEDLKNIQLEEKVSSQPKDAVDITSDEFEALEGFSKFHSTSIITPTSPCEEPIASPIGGSPNFASQVCAMRQRVMTFSSESYQRG